jgi:hypothetical protein
MPAALYRDTVTHARHLRAELAFTVAVEELQSTDPALLGLTAEPLRGMTMVRTHINY